MTQSEPFSQTQFAISIEQLHAQPLAAAVRLEDDRRAHRLGRVEDRRAADGIVDVTRARLQALLDRRRADPVRLDVLRKGGARRTLQVYRLFDEYEPSLYLACDPFQAPEMSRIISSTSARSSP